MKRASLVRLRGLGLLRSVSATGLLAWALAGCGGSESTMSPCGTPDPGESYILGKEAAGCVAWAVARVVDGIVACVVAGCEAGKSAAWVM